MLEIIKVQKRADIESFFSQFRPTEQSWLVSDLKTKIELKKKLSVTETRMEGQGDIAIQRMSELWEYLFRQEFPEKKTISREWARTVLAHFLKNEAKSLNLSQSSAGTLLEMIEFFIPLLAHQEGDDKFKDWMKTHPEVQDRWGDWYLMSQLCFKFLYHDKDWVLPSWYSPLLLQKDAALKSWGRPLWVDLGGQLLWSEAELLRGLSRHVDVRVFFVEGDWQKEFLHKLRPYQYLQTQTKNILSVPGTHHPQPRHQTIKLSGELAEIRHVVGQVRAWLEEGVKPQDIGVLAPDIEKYWPVLRSFFQQEGVPVNKAAVYRLSSLPPIQAWLAGLRVRLKDVRSADLEMHYFHQSEAQLSYEEFISLYANILTMEDLAHHSGVQGLYQRTLQVSTQPHRDEWISFILRQWNPKWDLGPLSKILEEYQTVSSQVSLPLMDWLSHLESIVARKEVLLEEADPEGIHLSSLLAAPAITLKKRFFLGLSEEGLKGSASQFLSRFEAERLFSDLGFYLENQEMSAKEYELRLLAQDPCEEDIFSFGAVSLTGQLQIPSGFWLQQPQHEEELKEPRKTRWDEMQQNSPASVLTKERGFRQVDGGNTVTCLQRDQDLVGFENFIPLQLPSLSASRVENYLNCPFKFAAETFFHLKDLPEMDLHVDPRNYGSFIHDLFEILTDEKSFFAPTESDLESTIQELYQNSHERSFHPELWPAFKKRLVRTALRFMDFESQWKKRFPKTKTIGREQRWVYEIFEKDGTLQVQRQMDPTRVQSEAFLISGKIDRVDTDGEGHSVIIDYKSGAASAQNFSQWHQNNKLQLLFYIWALENDSTSQDSVVGAFYYVFKNMERHRGLGLADAGENLFPVHGRYGALTDGETKKQLVKDLEKTVLSVMNSIQNGLFPPRPREIELCQTCRWNQLCRAPHLK